MLRFKRKALIQIKRNNKKVQRFNK